MSERSEIRNAAFAACPDTGCDWSSFYRGWLAAREAYGYAAIEVECERLTTQNRITGTMLEASLHANEKLHAERNALRVELERFSQANRELSEKNVRRRRRVRQLREALERATKLLSAAAECATKMEPMPAQLLNAIDAELDASTAKGVNQ